MITLEVLAEEHTVKVCRTDNTKYILSTKGFRTYPIEK